MSKIVMFPDWYIVTCVRVKKCLNRVYLKIVINNKNQFDTEDFIFVSCKKTCFKNIINKDISIKNYSN